MNPRACTAPALVCVLLLAASPSIAEDRVGYNSVGGCVTTSDSPGELYVTTVPALADVWVDGAKAGETSAAVPGSFRTSLAPGEHSVEIRKENYRTYAFRACVPNGKITFHETRLEFAPATPAPTLPPPTTAPEPPASPTASPQKSPAPTPEATKPPQATAAALLAFLDSALSDGQIPQNEELALRAALDRLRAAGNTSPGLFTPGSASCRAIAASIIREVGGCIQVDASSHPSIQSACCSTAASGAPQPPAARRSPGFGWAIAVVALGSVAATGFLAQRRRGEG
ncbi:MAG: PEGA domain-containing protein [Halobacteria archaeon]